MRNARRNITAALLAAFIIASSACSQTEVDKSASFVCGEYSVLYPMRFEEGYFAGRGNRNLNITFHFIVKSISEKEYVEANGINVIYDYCSCEYFSLRLSCALLPGGMVKEIPIRNIHLYLDEYQTMYIYTNDERQVTIVAFEYSSSSSADSSGYYYLGNSYTIWVSMGDEIDEQASMYKVADL